MGGIASVLEGYSNEEAYLTGDELANVMFRASVIGGISLCSVNFISGWSCQISSQGLGDELVVQCLTEYCYFSNGFWAIIALVSALVGIIAAMRKNWYFAIIFAILSACRGLWSFGEIAWALGNTSSCQAWSLSKNLWLPIVTFANVVVFVSLSWKFARSCRTLDSNNRFEDELQALTHEVAWAGATLTSDRKERGSPVPGSVTIMASPAPVDAALSYPEGQAGGGGGSGCLSSRSRSSLSLSSEATSPR